MARPFRPLLAAVALATMAACAAPPAERPGAAPTRVAASTAEPTPALPPSVAPSPSPSVAVATAVATAPPSPSAAPAPRLGPPTATPAFPDARIDEQTLPSLRMLRTAGLGGAVYAAIAPDNSLLAVATTAGVALFELPSLRHLRLDAMPGGAARVAFSADGQSLLVTTAGRDQEQRRRVVDGALEGTRGTSVPMFESEVLSPSGDVRATLPVPDSVPSPGATLTRVADGTMFYMDEDALTLSFSSDGATAALVTFRGDVRLVDARSGAIEAELALPPYWGVGFTPDALSLVTTGRSVWLWDVVAGTARQVPGVVGAEADAATLGGAQRVRYSADGMLLAVEGYYTYFEALLLRGSAWRAAGGALTPAWQSSARGFGITNLDTYVGATSPAAAIVAWTDDGVSLGLYREEEPLRALTIPERVSALAFSPDGALLAIGDREGQVRLVAVADGVEQGRARMDAEVGALVFSPGGGLLGGRTAGGALQVWRAEGLEPVALVRDQALATQKRSLPPTLDRFLFSADGELLVVWDDEAIRFYGLPDGRLLHTLAGGAEGAALGPRRRVLALLRDGRVELWGVPLAGQG